MSYWLLKHCMSMLVPPRKGQRHKSSVLPHFNKGHPFQIVEVYKNGIFQDYGVVDSTDAHSVCSEYQVWMDKAVSTTKVAASDLRAVNLPFAPVKAIEQFSVVIGGIGKHLRWRVVISKKMYNGACRLFVDGIRKQDVFQKFVEEQVRPFGFCDSEFVEHNGTLTTTVLIPNHKDLTYVAAAFHCANYGAVPLEDDMASCGNLGIERYDRSEHTWWNQNQKEAGPLRDTHKWKYSFIPAKWEKLPFTWFSLAENVAQEVNDVKDIPYPLRNYVCDHLLGTLDETDPRRDELLRQRTEQHCVTSRLTEAQNIQLLLCTYWTFVAPFDQKIVKLSGLLQFRYMMQGYIGREMGGYRQTAKHIGHGAYCRKFKSKPQYEYDNLRNEIKNRLETTRDGVVTGNGFKGTRGKYGHKDFPVYRPLKKMRRSAESELNIREMPINKFEEYKKVALKR